MSLTSHRCEAHAAYRGTRLRTAFRAQRDEVSLLSFLWRRGSRLTAALLLVVIAASLLAEPATVDLNGRSEIRLSQHLGAAQIQPGELPLEAGEDGAEDGAALKRTGFSFAAIDTSRRKLRTPQRPPAQALYPVTFFLPVADVRPLARRRHSERPLRPSQPPRPYHSQGPPSWKLS
jgi:hypothetical protein